MSDLKIREDLALLAAEGVPSVNLWPAISARIGDGARDVDRRQRGIAWRSPQRIGLALVLTLVAVVGWTLARPAFFGELTTAQAADVARHDPQVAALLRGDITIATVTQVVNEVATVVVKDGQGRQVIVTVDLRSRIVTKVVEGPQLAPALRDKAIAVVGADPRTSALLARGATIGLIGPIEVSFTRANPSPGQPAQGTETWAQVALDLGGREWTAYVDLPQSRIDQLLDPQGGQIPLP